jgi:AcrR family transcriptional regulator
VNAFSEPAGTARAAQKAATRARVLEVARAQLERDGYEATGIRSVARAAGVAAGTVLLHFRDKQDLLHAALADELERTWARARRTARGRSLEDDLHALARTFFDHYLRRPALSRALLEESLFAAPPWSARFAAQVAGVHAHVVTLVEAAKARGEIAADADAPLLGAAFFSFYYFALISWVQGGLPDPVRLFRRMLAQHLDGLRARAAKPRRRQR